MHKATTLRHIIKDIINEADESPPPSKTKKSIFDNPNVSVATSDEEEPDSDKGIFVGLTASFVYCIPPLDFSKRSEDIEIIKRGSMTIDYDVFYRFMENNDEISPIEDQMRNYYVKLYNSAKEELKHEKHSQKIVALEMAATWDNKPPPRLLGYRHNYDSEILWDESFKHIPQNVERQYMRSNKWYVEENNNPSTLWKNNNPDTLWKRTQRDLASAWKRIVKASAE